MEETLKIDPTIVSALIASLISLIIAIFTNIRQQKANNRTDTLNFENAKEIEYLKSELLKKNEFQNNELKSKADALHNSSIAIQLLKDDLRKIKMSVEDSLDLEPIFEDIKKSTDNLSKIYADTHMYLGQIDIGLKEQLHRAKNVAINIQSEFNREIKAYNISKKISPTFIKNIIDRRNELNEIDIRLIEKKAELSYINRI